MYTRLCNALNDKGILVPINDDVYNHIDTVEHSWFKSVYNYNEDHLKEFNKSGTIAGITDVLTNKIWFDFDSEFEPLTAKDNTVELVKRLLNLKISHKDICITFSGNKGFGVEVNINTFLSPKKVKEICFKLAEGLPTFDVKMYNASRVFRVIATKHEKTGLYKIPLTKNQLFELSMDDIINLAKKQPEGNDEFEWSEVELPQELITTKEKEVVSLKKPNLRDLGAIEWGSRPKFLSPCRWALQNGMFDEGDRSTVLLCLASTYKNLGYDQEITYRMLKGVAELQSQRTGSDRFPDNEIYNNIILQVYSNSWKNGQFTCREPNTWLNSYCCSLGDKKCDHKLEDDLKPKTFLGLKDKFKIFCKTINENTIYTGLPSLDNLIFLSTGAFVQIIGAPGSGKTSIGLELLENTSKEGVLSVCAGLDMASNRFFEKVLYRVTGLPREELYHKFQTDTEQEILDDVKKRYENVYFFKKSSANVQDIKDYILNVQEQTGRKVKLLVIDYFERVNSDIGDDTAASKAVAGELQDLIDDLDICLILLVQPNKAALGGGPDKPIYDYTKIKGSSFVYQAARIILSAWRPFYHPKDFKDDKYMQMAVLKNDFGELGEISFGWEGKRGLITELEDFQRDEFESLLQAKNNREGREEGFG